MKTLLIVFLFLIPTLASAEDSVIFMENRCAEDSLDPAQARLRNQWARKCYPEIAEDLDYYERRNRRPYVLVHHTNGSWRGPLDPKAPCDGWTRKSFCVASCYPADQLVWFEGGFTPIGRAVDKKLDGIITLKANSTIDMPKFKVSRVRSYSRSRTDSDEIILTFRMASGGQLRVTTNHPMLTSDGIMQEAAKLSVGQELVQGQGLSDKIVEISSRIEFGKVYNVSPDSGNPVENIVIAQGYLTGSAAYQYAEELNTLYGRKLLRRMIEIERIQ